MAAPEYINDLRKSSQLGFGVYSWLQLVDLVSRHDMSANGIRTRANKKVRCTLWTVNFLYHSRHH